MKSLMEMTRLFIRGVKLIFDKDIKIRDKIQDREFGVL